MPKIFFDTEFHEGFRKPWLGRRHHFIDLISIGLVKVKVASTGVADLLKLDHYNAVSADFDVKAAWECWQKKDVSPSLQHLNGGKDWTREYWLRNNVLRKVFDELLTLKRRSQEIKGTGYDDFNYENLKALIKEFGKPNDQIAKEIQAFVGPGKEKTEFFTYYGDYDWVAFCTLYGKMMNLPEGFPMYAIDLKQTLDEHAKIRLGRMFESYNNSQSSIKPPSFDSCLEDIKRHNGYPVQAKDTEHTAIGDAYWNYSLYKFLYNHDPLQK